MKSFQIALLTGLLMLGQALHAETLHVRALALSADPAMPERYVKVADGYEKLSFSSMQPSGLVRALAAEAALPLFELKQNPKGEVAYALVEKIKLPAGAKGVLLLGWASKDAARYLAIDDDYLSAKFNDWLLVNAGDKPIAFQIGREEKPIPLKGNSIVNHRINTRENAGLDVVARSQWGEKVKTFYSTYWPVRSGERAIVIFYERGDRIAVRRITDVLLKAEEAAKIREMDGPQSLRMSDGQAVSRADALSGVTR